MRNFVLWRKAEYDLLFDVEIMRGYIFAISVVMTAGISRATTPTAMPQDIVTEELEEVVVVRPKNSKLRADGMNTELITAADLKKAACCNLGEFYN